MKYPFPQSMARSGALELSSHLRAVLWPISLLLSLSAGELDAKPSPAYVDEMGGEKPILAFHAKRQFRLIKHEVEVLDPVLQSSAEVLTAQGPSGESAEIEYRLPTAPVIEELVIQARILSNRRGVQIAARVTLPRSLDPETNLPRQLIIRGSNLSSRNAPSLLRLENLPILLERQARVERLKHPETDTREAFVSDLLFLLPGGSGSSRLAIDRIEVQGILQDLKADPRIEQTAFEDQAPIAGEGGILPPRGPSSSVVKRMPSQRIIQWQGEPLEFLAKLGFNCVWLDHLPSDEQLAEARRLSLRMVCPPPDLSNEPVTPLNSKWDPVLCWDLGALSPSTRPGNRTALRQQLRRVDPASDRTALWNCDTGSAHDYRGVDCLFLRRPLLGSDLSIREYAIWLDQRIRLGRPGTSVWVALETNLPEAATNQIRSLTGLPTQSPFSASYDHLCTAVTAAVSVRCRDFVFLSDSPLTAADQETRRRVLALELINLRLSLLDSWLTSENRLIVARSSQPGISALLLRAERSHLLLPVNWSRNCRTQSGIQANNSISFVVPGISESADAYLLSLTGAERITHQRTAGGILIKLPSLPVDGVILLTNDPNTFSHVSRYLRSIASRATARRRELLSLRIEQLSTELAQADQQQLGLAAQMLHEARLKLTRCDQGTGRGQFEFAYAQLVEADDLLSKLEYQLRMMLGGMSHSELSPLQFAVSTAPEAAGISTVLGSFARGPELLPAGPAEDLTHLLASGWLQQRVELPEISSDVRLSADSPASGNYCLELESKSIGTAPIAVVAVPPVRITTPVIELDSGDFVEVQGKVRVPEPVLGSVDGLTIQDSVGGEALATRIIHAPSWTSFRYVRRMPSDAHFSLELILTGLGRAQLDDLSIRKLIPPAPAFAQQRPLPPPR